MKVEHFLKVGFVMDALRLWPRVFVSLYFVGGWLILQWYLRQDAATWDRSAFAGVYASLGLPLLKWYMENGVDWDVVLPMWIKRLRSKDLPAPEHHDDDAHTS